MTSAAGTLVETLLQGPIYSLAAAEKTRLFEDALGDLTRHHFGRCAPYRRMLSALGIDPAQPRALADFPFLPARLFKMADMRSIDEGEIKRVLTSSGTGGTPSKIYLDAATAAAQAKVLTRIVGDFIGTARLPMLVIDAPSTGKSRDQLSARTAAILGFSIFGRDITYALADDMSIDRPAIDAFLERHGDRPILLFGFTSIVYRHFAVSLRAGGVRLSLDKGVLIHGGGWKKLADQAVDNTAFKALLAETAGLTRVHNYYGLVEQTGSIFMECAQGHFHCSDFSDVLIRGPDFSVRELGRKGLIELMSLLPRSYPGHVLLTEDEGTLLGVDDCPCGRRGRYFQVHGRVARAEVRGCSDAYASR